MSKKVFVPAVLLGCAIGDSLGMPFESYGCDVHPGLKDWDGSFVDGNYHNLKAGQWTDDTEMSKELVQALIGSEGFKGPTVASKYVLWILGNPTGTGSTTRQALKTINSYAKVEEMWDKCGVHFEDREAVGSGTAMRAAPIGVVYHGQPEMIRKVCRQDAYITHANREAYAASLAVAAAVAALIGYAYVGDAYSKRVAVINFVLRQMIVVEETLTAKAVKLALTDYLSSTNGEFVEDVAGRFGSAWQCTSTALQCFFHGWPCDFMRPIQDAVRLGGDADTRAAIVGALQGARFGITGIPEDIMNKVHQATDLGALDVQLATLGRSKQRT